MGLSRADGAEWLIVDDQRDSQLALKRRLLAEHRVDVLAFAPDIDSAPACAELLRMLENGGRMLVPLRGHGPAMDPENGGGSGGAGASGTLERAAGSVQEDLCVLLPDASGRLVLAAACVCFPSHWRLRDKIGLPVSRIHVPVPRYEQELARKVDTFVERLRPGVVMTRRNWLIHETGDLFVPDPPAAADPAMPPEQLWLRSERQALRRLPESGGVAFTIHTQQAQIGVLERRPDVAAALAARLVAQPGELTRYAEYRAHVPALVHRLRAWRS
jgi:hypothetical protein